jgi:hypothetical protein
VGIEGKIQKTSEAEFLKPEVLSFDSKVKTQGEPEAQNE